MALGGFRSPGGVEWGKQEGKKKRRGKKEKRKKKSVESYYPSGIAREAHQPVFFLAPVLIGQASPTGGQLSHRHPPNLGRTNSMRTTTSGGTESTAFSGPSLGSGLGEATINEYGMNESGSGGEEGLLIIIPNAS